MRLYLIILLLNCACLKLQAQLNVISTVAGSDSMGYNGDGKLATSAILHFPATVCIDKSGNLLIADALNNRVRKIVLSTGIITTVAGTGVYGYSGDGGQATDAELWTSIAVYTDTLGDIYIADAQNHRVRKIIASTGIISTIAGTGIAGNSGDGNLATNAEIDYPEGLFIDTMGNIYIADCSNNNIRKVSPDGIISTVAGIGHMGYSGDGGPATNAQLYCPIKAIVDNNGNIIISDAFNNVLRKVNVSTGIISTIAGNGTAGYSGNGGLAVNALLNGPCGIFIDKQNNIYFAEWGNGTIRKIEDSTGIITTLAGIGTQGFSGDGGPATAAQLIPEDVCFDKNGIMYIADFGNQRIRIVYSDKLGTSSIIGHSEAIKISPNPAQDELTIENAIGRFFCIYNMIGREVYRGKIVTDKETLPIKGFPVGLYLAEFTDEKGLKQTIRFVKNE